MCLSTAALGAFQGVRPRDAGGGLGARGDRRAHRRPDDRHGPLGQRHHRAVEGGAQGDLAGPARAHRDSHTGTRLQINGPRVIVDVEAGHTVFGHQLRI